MISPEYCIPCRYCGNLINAYTSLESEFIKLSTIIWTPTRYVSIIVQDLDTKIKLRMRGSYLPAALLYKCKINMVYSSQCIIRHSLYMGFKDKKINHPSILIGGTSLHHYSV